MKPFLFIFLIIAGCSVFDLGNEDDNYFPLTIEHNISRIVDSAVVSLKWKELSTEGFLQFRIEKRFRDYSEWELAGIITNRIATTYNDVIHDDEDLEYRVGLENDDGDILWMEGEVQIPKTLQLFVPLERSTIMEAINDSLIDAGDTVWVAPGEYQAALDFRERNIVLISSAGASETTILGDPVNPRTVIRMNTGILDGFKISEGSTLGWAGGIDLQGSGIVRRCILTENFARLGGGGLAMKGTSELWNCVVFNNFGDKAANVLIRNTGGKIINCVFTNLNLSINSNITMDLESSDLIMLNNIIYQSPGAGTNVVYSAQNDTNGVIFDYSFVNPASDYGNSSGIETGIPGFLFYEEDETLHFYLEPDSPCLNAGHPGAEHLNRDGTRNTIGPTGGPWGW